MILLLSILLLNMHVYNGDWLNDVQFGEDCGICASSREDWEICNWEDLEVGDVQYGE